MIPDMSATHLEFTIGELAGRTGCTSEAVRFYEREGVLPRPERRGGGRYRRNSAADVERVLFVKRARDLGFSLAEVREHAAWALEAIQIRGQAPEPPPGSTRRTRG
jgi:DNA-binding transcriptional MerR regulator